MKIPKGKSKFIIIFCIIIQSQTIDRKHLYRLKQGSVVFSFYLKLTRYITSAGKITRVVPVSVRLWMKVCPYHYFCSLPLYFQVLRLSIVTTDKFSVKVTKITSSIRVALTCNEPF